MEEVEAEEKRSRDDERVRRTRKQHSQLSGEKPPWELWVAEDLTRKSRRKTINSLSRKETKVVLRGRSETKHHQRQV